jgi:hypothetical protein
VQFEIHEAFNGSEKAYTCMEPKEPVYPPQNSYDKAEDSINRARDARKRKLANLGKSDTAPRLIADGKLERCSVCGYPFNADVRPSMSVAFAEHLLKAHQPGQTTEDVNQAAAHAVGESTSEGNEAD